MVFALALATVLAALTAPVFGGHNPDLSRITASYGVSTALLLLAIRVGVSERLGFAGLQLFTAVFLLCGRWTELDFDASWAMWLAVLPVTGMAFAGTRGGLWGLALSIVFALPMLTVRDPGLFQQVPVQVVGVVVRVLSFLVAMFFLSVAWQSLRAEALARAEAAAAARTLFLAKMSHELRTPMNGVLGFTDVLLESRPTAEQREALELMRRSGSHLLALINDVIDFARLDAGQFPLADEPVDLHELVSDTVELLRPAAERASLALTVRLEAGTRRWVRGDTLRLRQVLINLVGNAVKFTPRGSVEVALEARGSEYAFVVTDTGVGVEDGMAARLFQAFEQGGQHVGGSGLGLAISKRLVERMGGSIAFTSAVGKGSVFTVRLPLHEVDVPAGAAVSDAVPEVGLPPLRVLVVDDNDINLRVATALLEKAGCVPTPLTDGAAAIAAVREGDFDAVLMDCQMPGVDGFEATRRIRALGGVRGHVPIIALTASVLPEEIERCRAAGMDDWLGKPVTLAMLKETLARLPRRTRQDVAPALPLRPSPAR